MTDANILAILKIDLQISTDSLDTYLNGLIATAKTFIETEGINLDANSTADSYLVEMYAAYLYRHRRENAPMPRALRWALNNRLFSEVRNDG